MMRFFWLLIFVWQVSCDATTRIMSIENKSRKVSGADYVVKSDLDSFLTPYRNQLVKKMNDTLAFSDKELTKEKVESTLGNWVADGMMWYAKTKLNRDADIAICNSGGLRVKSLPSGPILLKHIFELMPFENELVVLDIDSTDLKVILEKIAEKDGWPVSRGFYMHLSSDNKILDWNVNGIRKAQYKIIVSDYIATGGDGMSSLIMKPRSSLNALIRDALIMYAKDQKQLHAHIEGRIIKD